MNLKKDIDKFLEHKLILDCPKIILKPCSQNSGKRSLVGAGMISAEAPGKFVLKVFFEKPFPIEETFESLNWNAGKVIGEEHYYDLEARDLSGITWKSEHILPDRSVGPAGAMITATFKDLHHADRGHPKAKGTHVSFYFDEILMVPLNTVVQHEVKVDGKSRSFSTGLKLAKFSTKGVKLEVDNSTGRTVLRAFFDDSNVTLERINRLFESLRFVLAYTSSWSVLVISCSSFRISKLRAIEPKLVKTRIGPPLHISNDPSSQQVWELFDKYFCYVCQDTKAADHSISILNKTVLESGKASLEVQALILSVSVEALLMDRMEKLYKVSDKLLNNINCTRHLVNECVGLGDSFRNRILGALGAMKHPRAADILTKLNKLGLVNGDLVKIYKKLRNRMAHELQDPNADIQDFINKTNAVLVLFYQLVFLIIGYQGNYSDYSQYGYPTKEFSAKLA